MRGQPMREQASVIRWEDPPPSKRSLRKQDGSSRYADVAEELRANPGRWAVVLDGLSGSGSSLATQIRMGYTVCFCPAGDFDATIRQTGGRAVVYARYVGDGES